MLITDGDRTQPFIFSIKKHRSVQIPKPEIHLEGNNTQIVAERQTYSYIGSLFCNTMLPESQIRFPFSYISTNSQLFFERS